MKARFAPILAGAELRERLVRCGGAVVGIALTMLLCAPLHTAFAALPAIVAPVGASAVLVFAVPASPLAQPWPVIGGNLVSALIGLVAGYFGTVVPLGAALAVPLAAGLGVGGAILAMSLLRCLHPPGGAVALIAATGGAAGQAAGLAYPLVPVVLNSVVLVLVATVFHRLTRHAYPRNAAANVVAAAQARRGFDASDIDAALAEMHESFDIARADLDALLSRAEAHAQARNAGR